MDDETRAIADCWNFYYEREPFHIEDKRLILVRGFAEWFRNEGATLLSDVHWINQSVVTFHYDDFKSRCPYPDFSGALREEPVDLLRCLALALCVIRSEHTDGLPLKLTARMMAVTPLLPLKELKSNCVAKFVSVRGNIVRVSGVRPLVVKMSFTCTRCACEVQAWFTDGKFEPPTSCVDSTCRGKSFVPNYATAVAVDWQKIRIQELEADVSEAGRVPRTVEVELSEDLVDSCVPGDVVTVGGIVKAMETDVAAGKGTARGKSLFLLYLDAASITTQKVSERGAQGAPGSSSKMRQFSEKDLVFISKIRKHRDPFSLIVASCCPNIYGHEMVKGGLLLGLFGGTPRNFSATAVLPAALGRNGEGEGESGHASSSHTGGGGGGTVEPVAAAAATDMFEKTSSKLHVRSDPHVLVVGDPGMGKSQMLQAIAGLAPRGVYVCGNTTSASGLTVTMVRDPTTGDYGLEAGALVLGDQGVCCIDEFDKMSSEHQALLEAMEQQRISIAKAGIVSSLSARTSVLAAANPVGGHYNKGKTIQENLKMNPALLSRFDLIFILLDRPDDIRDRQLSEHVMAMHDGTSHKPGPAATATITGFGRGGGDATHTMGEDVDERLGAAGGAAATQAAHERARRFAGAVEQRRDSGGIGGGEAPSGRQPLDIRLRRGVLAISPPEILPPQLLRKYVAYARKYCYPALLPEAAAVLQSFYLELRGKHGSTDTTPITTRQLESMIRLAEARAKIELREYVTKADAEDVVEMTKASLFDAVTDEFGSVDFSKSSGMSMGKSVKLFVQALNKAASNRGHAKFTTDELERFAKDMRLQVTSFADFLEVLNQQSYLIKCGNREWKLLTSLH